MTYLALMFTLQCNARCRHCNVIRFGNEVRDMPVLAALRYIDEMVTLSDGADSFSVYLSGGEPFLRYQDMLTVVRHGKERGADQISCVTNGFWGKEEAIARQRAAELRTAGMTQICFSLDDFHQEYIPLKSVLGALKACRQEGLCFAIKSTVTSSTRRLPQILNELGDLLLDTYVPVQELAYVPRVKTGDRIKKDEWLLQEGLPRDPCPEIGILAVLPNGVVFPCCGSGWTRQLVVGNALVEPIVDLMHRINDTALFASLRDKGPAFFVPYFTQAGCPLPQEQYVNRCHLCMTILDHPLSEKILQLALAD